MLTFGLIISESGLKPEDFSTLSNIPVKLYDRKNRELTEEKDFNFGKKLFAKNPDSQEKFREILEKQDLKYLPKEILVNLSDSALILRFPYHSPFFLWLF